MSPASEKNDELLAPFLSCSTEYEDSETLASLLTTARPIIHNVLRNRGVLFDVQSELSDDLKSLTIARIIEQLRKCKHSWQQEEGAIIIHHFPALCQTIASNVVTGHLRLKYPLRSRLQNQLLYLIREVKDANGLPRFGIWQDRGKRVCGFRAWEKHRAFVLTQRQRLLRDDFSRASYEVFQGADTRSMPLEVVLEAVLRWMELPIVFDTLVSAIGQWQGIEEYSEQSLSPTGDSAASETVFEPVATELLPDERAVFRESMEQLWGIVVELPTQQRAALLLNLRDAQGRGVLGFLPTLGIVSLREIATALGFDVKEFAALWPRLPLEDREIANMYGCKPEAVCVWRSRARAHLRKRMEEQ